MTRKFKKDPRRTLGDELICNIILTECNSGHPLCNDPTIGSYNHYHLSPNGIPRGDQRWYGLVYFVYTYLVNLG